jgi:uncharacterized Zn-binding protein involved in type VI secretion
VGPAIAGSSNVFINGRPALRVDDVGIHGVCCGPNMWSAADGAPTVFINGKPAFRRGDPTRHCGGSGKLVEGSPDVEIGQRASVGAGMGGSGGAAGGSRGGAASPGGSSPQDRGAAAHDHSADATVAGSAAHSSKQAETKDWIEIELVDIDGRGVGGEEYVIELPDGSTRRGRLDDCGKARLDGIAAGVCTVSFPRLDADAWQAQ